MARSREDFSRDRNPACEGHDPRSKNRSAVQRSAPLRASNVVRRVCRSALRASQVGESAEKKPDSSVSRVQNIGSRSHGLCLVRYPVPCSQTPFAALDTRSPGMDRFGVSAPRKPPLREDNPRSVPCEFLGGFRNRGCPRTVFLHHPDSRRTKLSRRIIRGSPKRPRSSPPPSVDPRPAGSARDRPTSRASLPGFR
jgi:hypothetical protein